MDGLVLDRVTKTYPDGTQALAGVTLTVAAGELVCVVGPSGCGKSTLLRVASGLDHATEGSVTRGHGHLEYVFQDPTLLAWRTVRRNVELPGELHGTPAAERRAAADHALATVGLQDAAEQYPRALSGGMRMRASLARALTMQPSVFLFDEPFGAMDEITRERLNDELLALFSAAGFAGLFVTHSVAEAVYLGSRVVVLSPRPAQIVAEIGVPLPRPRVATMRFEPTFAATCRSIGEALRA